MRQNKGVTHFKKSEFIGQIRVTPDVKVMIKKALKFYGKSRGEMAAEVMAALFHHFTHGEKIAFPLRFVVEQNNSSNSSPSYRPFSTTTGVETNWRIRNSSN
jgi:hypothetical protein